MTALFEMATVAVPVAFWYNCQLKAAPVQKRKLVSDDADTYKSKLV